MERKLAALPRSRPAYASYQADELPLDLSVQSPLHLPPVPLCAMGRGRLAQQRLASLPRSSFPGPIRRPRLGGLLSARTELFFLTVMVVNPMRFTVSTFDARSGERLKKETITKCARLERRLGEIEREMNRIVDSIVVAGMPPERDHPRIGRVHHRACQPKPAWRCGNQSECRGQSECTDRHKGPSCRALRRSRPFPEHGYVGENVGSGRALPPFPTPTRPTIPYPFFRMSPVDH